MISQNPNFVSKKELDILVKYALKLNETDKWDKSDPSPDWHNRYIHASTLVSDKENFGQPEDILAYKTLIEIRIRIKEHIIKIRNLGVPLYSDTLQLVRWLPGNEQTPHADAEHLDGQEHPYPWRDYASIVYLNNDYEGGRIYFPDHNLELSPEPGTMVTFPGSTEYMHGVSKVTSGLRLTSASFWTLDPNHSDRLPI